MRTRIKNYIKGWQLKSIVRSKSYDINDNFLVFSDPRGGSTWLTEAISCIPKTAILWEPLHLKFNPEVEKIGFDWRQYIPHDADWPEAKNEFDQIFSGQRILTTTTHISTIADYQNAERLIVKFCRGNSLLPWLISQYKFRFKPIYLIRHPFSVVASQMIQGGWDNEINEFSIPDNNYNQLYIKHQDFLKTLTTKAEVLIATWCLTNSVALESHLRDQWITVTYESLFLEPAKQVERIFSDWGIEVPASLYQQLDTQSDTTVTKVDFKNKESQLRKWEKQFSTDEIARFVEILTYFEISLYSDHYLPENITP